MRAQAALAIADSALGRKRSAQFFFLRLGIFLEPPEVDG
jgi:hypothetical protein